MANSQSILAILLRTKSDNSGVKQAQSALKGINNFIQNLTGTNLISATSFAAVSYAIKQTVTDTLTYSDSVRKLSQNLSISTEEASKIIQVGDDFQVSVEQIETAMKMAVQNGFRPSIDSLAELADKYVATQDPIARANMLQSIFKKQWSNMAPLFSQGGEAIREAAKDAEKAGLVLSSDAVQGARDFEIALDKLKDSAEGVKYSVGTELIQALNAFLDPETFASNTVVTHLEKNILMIAKAKEAGREYSAEKRRQFTDELIGIQMTDRANRMLAAGLDLTAKNVVAVQDAEINATAVMKDYTKELLYNQAAAGLDADAAIYMAEQMGLVDQTSLVAMTELSKIRGEFDAGKITAEQYAERVSAINSAIVALQDKHVVITVDTIERYMRMGIASPRNLSGSRDADIGMAPGGPVYAGERYTVGEEGPEKFRPAVNGEILPHGAGGGTNYFYAPVTFKVENGQTLEQVMAELAVKRG